jgi:hypothetical protein
MQLAGPAIGNRHINKISANSLKYIPGIRENNWWMSYLV